jgi:lactate dehydrogenase-like 2-hydroxyacid dehydrogenase
VKLLPLDARSTDQHLVSRILAAQLAAAQLTNPEQEEPMKTAIIGLGNIGSQVASNLAARG